MSERDGIEGADTIAADGSGGLPSLGPARMKIGDRYEVLGLLGAGGMGAVYRVRDVELGEVVALKMLRPGMEHGEVALERFRREVRLARRVTHKNVARTFDIGEHGGERFLTMEYVDGASLAARIVERGAMSAHDAIEIATAICDGLTAAHDAGVVHRDLKPENVLIARDGRVLVTDFGIANACGAGETTIVGTPAYMAPEQLLLRSVVDHRADLYALGAVIYEMVTGERAWKGDAPMLLLVERARTTEPPDPRRFRTDLSGALTAIIQRCMAVDPAARFASAAEVAHAMSLTNATSTVPRAPAALPMPAPRAKTVAVLPLRNLGGADDAYIAEGLTDDLIDTLSAARGLLVRPRGVVARYRGSESTPQEVGNELSVQVIVEGSVQRVGSHIKLSVRLIGVNDGFQLWARRFVTPLDDFFTVTSHAARDIAEALTTDAPGDLGGGGASAGAVELYWRAKHEFWRSWNQTGAPAVALFERALSLAPADPKILAGSAAAYVRMLFFGEGDRERVIERCRELAENAVALAPNLGESWATLASFRLNVGDFAGAGLAAGEGLAHAASSAPLQEIAGSLLAEVDALDEAALRLGIAQSLDPSQQNMRVTLLRVHALRGEWSRVDALSALLGDGVTFDSHRARLALWRGRPIAMTNAPPNTFGRIYAELHGARELSAEGRAFLERRPREAAGRMRALMAQRGAEVYAFLDDVEAALGQVDLAVESGLIDLAWLDRCGLLTALRTSPRWTPLRATVAARAQLVLESLRRTIDGPELRARSNEHGATSREDEKPIPSG